MRRYAILLVSMVFLLETVYFNILFDYALVFGLMILALALGNFVSFRLKKADALIVKLALGLGGIGFFVWLTTFYNVHHKSLFIVFAIFLMVFQYRHVSQDVKYIYDTVRTLIQTHTLLLVLVISGIIFYTIPASYPITQWDSLAKHIVIPFQIWSHGYYDYNVVESIIFGDYALLSHMLYFFLMTFGGVKALVLLNVVISLVTLIAILRISSVLSTRQLPLYCITLLYFTTPLIYTYSTILNVDLYPVFFIAVSLVMLRYAHVLQILKNLPVIALLCGFAFFAKQVAFYLIVPMAFYILGVIAVNYKRITLAHIGRVVLSIVLFFVPFVPAMGVIWYKTGNPLFPFLNTFFQSPYFALVNFQDPYLVWKRFLGFDFTSLYSIVFHTSRNTEYIDKGVGFHLLLIPLAIVVWLFFWRNKYVFLLMLMSLGSYWVSVTFFNPNIRYVFGGILLAIPLVVLASEKLILKLKWSGVFSALLVLAVSIATIENVHTLFKTKNSLGFKPNMLYPNSELTESPTEPFLESINTQNTYLLSNNEALRGDYKGHFYTLTWYNSMLMGKIAEKKITQEDFLQNFDYYLINKVLPVMGFDPKLYKEEGHLILDPKNPQITAMLEVVKEDAAYVLYKIKKKYISIAQEEFQNAPSVDVTSPKVIPFEHKPIQTTYRISLDVAPSDVKKETHGRFQINWLNKDGAIIGVSIVPFLLGKQRAVYEQEIKDIPANAAFGHLYLTSHSSDKMEVFGYRLQSHGGRSFIENELRAYGQKLMPTYQ